MADLKKFRRRLSGALIAAALGGLLVADVTPAAAQGFGFLDNLFGGFRSRPTPAYPGYGDGGGENKYYAPRKTPRKKRPAVADQAPDAGKKAAPKNATLFVDVYGDSMGQLLAGGLDDALSDRAEVGVVRKAKGSTGLVTTSFYDWPKVIREQLGLGEPKEADEAKDGKSSKDAKAKESKAKDEKTKEAKGGEKANEAKEAREKDAKDKAAKETAAKDAAPKDKVDVAVMMIGINDRQTITEGGKKYEPGSDEWVAIYKKRILAINEAFAKKKIPLIWVGIPITKDDNFADDMAALNEIYREMAAKTGATYVDTWEAFSDDDGKFAAFGPDVNGQVVRLRTEDGIHFTKAGARKLAHFVETHVRRDLDGKAPVPQLPTAEAPQSDGKQPDGKKPAGEKKGEKPAVAVVKPEAGPIKNLAEAPTAKDGRLTEVPRDASPASFSAKGHGESPAPPASRADNFRWPAGGAPPAQ